jgi:hypothetical protein
MAAGLMYDPDPQRPALRLGELADGAEARANGYLQEWMKDPSFCAAVKAPNPHRPPANLEDALARVTLTQHDMERANLRWVEAMMDYEALRAQSQPISAARPVGDGNVRF